jgi:hypothetical protein
VSRNASCIRVVLSILALGLLILVRVLGLDAFGDTALKIGMVCGALIGITILVRSPVTFLALYYAGLILVREFPRLRIGPVYMTEAVIVLLLVRLVMFRKLGTVFETLRSQKLLLPLSGVLFMGFLSLVRGFQNGMLAARDSVTIFYCVIALIAVGILRSERQFARFIRWILIIGALLNVLLIVQLFTVGFGHSEMATPRLFGSRTSGFLFLVGSLAVTGYTARTHRSSKRLRYFGIGQYILVILMSGTRNVWIATLVTFMFWLMFFRKGALSTKSILVYSFVIILFASGVFLLSREQYAGGSMTVSYERALSSIVHIQKSSNAVNRLEWWKEATAITLRENPLWGKPFGSMTLFAEYDPKYDTMMKMAFHNSYVTIFYYTGLLGISFFMVLLYRFFRIGINYSRAGTTAEARKVSTALTLSFLFYCIIAIFNVILEGPQSAIVYWLIPGLILALGRLDWKHAEAVTASTGRGNGR